MITRCTLRIILLTGIFALPPIVSFAEPLEGADMVPAVLSESDQAVLSKEKAKLDELRKGLLNDIKQQNTECEQVAESNTFQVDLCRNRQDFIMSQIQNYKSRLKDYRDKIQKALFMAPQGKAAVQSGLVFKDIPAPAPGAEPSSSPVLVPPAVTEYFNDPQNHPRVQTAKDEADQARSLHVATSQAMLDEASRAMADVRAKTVAKNPHLGREEVDKIVSQDPEVRRKAAAWYLVHSRTKQQATDAEADYEHVAKEVAQELDRKRRIE